jgi:hypothetical protein
MEDILKNLDSSVFGGGTLMYMMRIPVIIVYMIEISAMWPVNT